MLRIKIGDQVIEVPATIANDPVALEGWVAEQGSAAPPAATPEPTEGPEEVPQ